MPFTKHWKHARERRERNRLTFIDRSGVALF
jgi:hypothetical protein